MKKVILIGMLTGLFFSLFGCISLMKDKELDNARYDRYRVGIEEFSDFETDDPLLEIYKIMTTEFPSTFEPKLIEELSDLENTLGAEQYTDSINVLRGVSSGDLPGSALLESTVDSILEDTKTSIIEQVTAYPRFQDPYDHLRIVAAEALFNAVNQIILLDTVTVYYAFIERGETFNSIEEIARFTSTVGQASLDFTVSVQWQKDMGWVIDNRETDTLLEEGTRALNAFRERFGL